MSRYIDKDKLLDDLNWVAPAEHYEDFSTFIKKQPEVEVSEVKHGRNIDAKYRNGNDFICSECGCLVEFASLEVKYCPNCGAKIDNADSGYE